MIDQSDVAVEFSVRLRCLAADRWVRDLETGELRKVTAGALHEVLAESGYGWSRRLIYRVWSGEGAAPRLDLVVALAEALGVAPSALITDVGAS